MIQGLRQEASWEDDFQKAIVHARKYNLPQLEDIHNLNTQSV
jgi:hypothetical protein